MIFDDRVKFWSNPGGYGQRHAVYLKARQKAICTADDTVPLVWHPVNHKDNVHQAAETEAMDSYGQHYQMSPDCMWFLPEGPNRQWGWGPEVVFHGGTVADRKALAESLRKFDSYIIKGDD